MSLDVYLYDPEKKKKMCFHCGQEYEYREELFEANITHNLNTMASNAGIYSHLWRPDEIGITKAKDLIEPLTNGLKNLIDNPEYFKQFSAKNGWGTYEQFIPWIKKYLDACIEYPESDIDVSR